MLTLTITSLCADGCSGGYNGITIRGAPRDKEHDQDAKMDSSLHYEALRLAGGLDRRVVRWCVRAKDSAAFAAKLRKKFPRLAHLTDHQLIQVFLIALEAVHCIRFRSFCGSILYGQSRRFLGPLAGAVGLNSTNCLNTGICGVVNYARSVRSQKRMARKSAEREQQAPFGGCEW